MKTCFCGKEFEPRYWNQVHCCPRHERIYTRARRSEYGKALIKEKKAALRYYSYVE